MALQLDWLGFAEGSAIDMRGSVTLVGFNPQVIFVERFPGQVAPTIVLVVEDTEDPEPLIVPGKMMKLRLQVTGPDGEVVLFTEQEQQVVTAKPFAEVRGRVQLLAQIPFPAGKVGEHKISVRLSIGGVPSVAGERVILVAETGSLDRAS